MKGNNGTNIILYYNIVAQTIKDLPHVSMLEPGILDCKIPWALFPMQGTA
jgi:hypothetical protein